MDAERWARAKEIFSEVVDLEPAERTRLLTEACGEDDELRREVESLLEAESGAPTFLDGNAPEYAAPSLSELIPRDGAETEPDPLLGGSVGDIRITEVIGHGGFGRVYLGRDTKLDRDVAVKALRSSQRSHPEARERLKREARLLSKLDHPSICRIYGLVEEKDRDYLLLEFIDGPQLTEAMLEADETAKLEAVRKIAAALDAAHKEGIIHRDLKPDNVLVTGDGVVKVLDLGISRIEGELATPGGTSDATTTSQETKGDSADLTRLGSRLGTIRYMSPEQARGEALTTASDLFALGLMVHELFGQAPAYQEDSPEQLVERVRRGETEPFVYSDPDLVTLVGDLVRKDPADRPTATQVIERIEAIQDRPRRRRQRLFRRIAAGVSLAAGLVFLFGWLWVREKAASDIAVAEDLLAQAKDIEWRMRAEYLSPKHDIGPAKEEVRTLLEELAEQIEELGSVAVGPGRYALGRAAFSIGDIPRARREVEAAWESGYQTPEVAYTLGRVLARQFRDAIEWNARRYKPEEREERLVQLRADFGEPAARFLRLAREARVDSPEYVESLLAISEQDFNRALAELSKIHRAWFYERDLLVGWIQGKLSDSPEVHGSPEAIIEHLSLAEEAYGRAVKTGRSDPRGYLGLCRIAAFRVYRTQLSPEDAREQGQEAVETCQEALRVEAGMVQAQWELASAHASLADAALQHGDDAGPHLDAAERVAEQGLATSPESRDLQRILVQTLVRKGTSEQLAGVDPRSTFERGRRVSDLLAASDTATLKDLNVDLLLGMEHANYQISSGESPLATLERGIEIGKRAIEIEPHPVVRSNLSAYYYLLGGYQADHGSDPSAAIQAGLAQVEETLSTMPEHPGTLRMQGNFYLLLYRHTSRTGGDVEQPLAAARQAYRQALVADPALVWVVTDLVELELLHARWLVEQGRSPLGSLESARVDLAKLDGSDDLALYFFFYGGDADLLEGRWRAGQGLPADRAYRRAEDQLRRAIRVSRLEAFPFVALAEVLYGRAVSAIKNGSGRGLGATDLIEQGLAAVDEALEVKSDYGDAHARRAALLRLKAEVQAGTQADRLLAEAEQAKAQACAINRFLEGCGAVQSGVQAKTSD